MIEVAAFVSPRWVPQMADAAEVFAGIAPARRACVHRARAEPDRARRALAAGVTEVAIFAAASETFSRAQHQPDDRGVAGHATRRSRATPAGGDARARVPLDGVRLPVRRCRAGRARVVELAERLRDLGAYEVAVSDTIGVAHPGQVWDVLAALESRLPLSHVALHFHDTRGTALANVLAALEAGVTTFDASAGGLGGCPYAPGAAGNLATEDLVSMLDGLGIDTGVHLDAGRAGIRAIEPALGHALPSRYLQAVRRGDLRP